MLWASIGINQCYVFFNCLVLLRYSSAVWSCCFRYFSFSRSPHRKASWGLICFRGSMWNDWKVEYAGPRTWDGKCHSSLLLYRNIESLKRMALTKCASAVTWPGIKPGPSSLRAQSHNHWTVRDQALSLWSGSTDSKTLDYQRTNPRDYHIVRTHTKETTWIQDLATPNQQ